MAVVPELQKNGIGSQLGQRGLAELRAAGHELVVVLGHPATTRGSGSVKRARMELGRSMRFPTRYSWPSS